MSWIKIRRSKKEGGITLGKIADLSQTCHLKLFLRFLDSESLLARWMKNKHLKRPIFGIPCQKVISPMHGSKI